MWGIIIASIVFAVGALFLVFRGDVELNPLRVLNPTNFSSSPEIGAVTFRRFWQEMNAEKLVILGSSPFLKEYDLVWRGFLSVAKENKIEFTHVFQQEGLRAIAFESSEGSFKVQALSWEQVQLALIGQNRVLVHVVATDQMWKEAAERTTGGFIIFQSLLPISDFAKNILNSSCRVGENIGFQISCQALKSLNQGKKKKIDLLKTAAVIEKHGLREHILYVHEAP